MLGFLLKHFFQHFEISDKQNWVQRLASLLNPNKSTGLDGMLPHVLKEMADVLPTPLTNLFQMSLDKRVVF